MEYILSFDIAKGKSVYCFIDETKNIIIETTSINHNKKEFEDSRIYVDLFPCNECAKKIIQNEIKEVIYLSDKYKDSDSTKASKHLFDTCRVKYTQLKKTTKRIIEVPLSDEKISYIEEI